MDLKDIDLNLLVVFQHLFVERRVSLVADKLGLTQPAISNALARLRKILDDELFLRTSRGMEPTPYANQLAEPIALALRTIQDTLSRKVDFSPAGSVRRFTIAMTDIGEIYFLPRLMRMLSATAPGKRAQSTSVIAAFGSTYRWRRAFHLDAGMESSRTTGLAGLDCARSDWQPRYGAGRSCHFGRRNGDGLVHGVILRYCYSFAVDPRGAPWPGCRPPLRKSVHW
jgi:DNA-binding Lrp family transcriptional regulator